GERRRLEAWSFHVPADEDLGALLDGVLDAVANLVELLLVDQRTDDGGRDARIADTERLGLGHELRDESVGDRTLDDEVASGHADLTLMQERSKTRRVHGVVDVRVAQDNQRVVAGKLERDALQVPAGLLGD